MDFTDKVRLLKAARCEKNSSKELCIEDAEYLFFILGYVGDANARLEKAAQYAWGFNRPAGWRCEQ